MAQKMVEHSGKAMQQGAGQLPSGNEDIPTEQLPHPPQPQEVPQ